MILITGAAGYIGSHCVLEFIQNEFDVLLFDNFSTGNKSTIKNLKKLDKNNHIKGVIEGDLKNPADLTKAFSEFKIDAVIHFAAYSLIDESMQNPDKYFKNNIEGSKNLLDVMIKFNVKNIIFSSTASVYGEPEYIPIDESHPKNPINTYGETKLQVENLMDEYDKKFGLKSIRLRYFNVVGASNTGKIGEDHTPETHLIPNILKSARNSSVKFKLYGTEYNTKDGTCIRDYIDVQDIANAHRLALNYLTNEQKTDVFNLSSEKGSSVKEIIHLCKEITNAKIDIEIHPSRKGDPAQLIATNKKVKNILKWEPKINLEQSIKNAWAWENTKS